MNRLIDHLATQTTSHAKEALEEGRLAGGLRGLGDAHHQLLQEPPDLGTLLPVELIIDVVVVWSCLGLGLGLCDVVRMLGTQPYPHTHRHTHRAVFFLAPGPSFPPPPPPPAPAAGGGASTAASEAGEGDGADSEEGGGCVSTDSRVPPPFMGWGWCRRDGDCSSPSWVVGWEGAAVRASLASSSGVGYSWRFTRWRRR